MKHGSFKAVCLIVWACIAVLASYGDEVTTDLTSIILEPFNNEAEHKWNDGKHDREYSFTWDLDASKFATRKEGETYPQYTYVDAYPIALFGYNREGKTIKSLGIHGRFDRRGYNWIDIYPKDGDGNPYEIRMPGRTRYLDLWVWGSNLKYNIYAFVRDYRGVVHQLRLGDIAYTGWKNLRVNVPNTIPQSKRIQPNLAALTFIKFRIETTPEERVGDFYVYFKQLKVLTDTFEGLFDGDELADPDHIPELWASPNTPADRSGSDAGSTN
jgi:hypothetical protein